MLFVCLLSAVYKHNDFVTLHSYNIMEDIIKNKIAGSSLITLDMEKFYPDTEIMLFDIKEFLFMELILKEKEYREALKIFDWSIYKNKNVAITCSADAIIPMWAYMLAVTYIEPFAKEIFLGLQRKL